MNNPEKYEVELFGQNFVLSTTDGKKQELKKVVEYYKTIVEELIEKLPNRQHIDIAILAGLKVADKLYTLASSKDFEVEEGDGKIQKIVDDAIKQLDISMGL